MGLFYYYVSVSYTHLFIFKEHLCKQLFGSKYILLQEIESTCRKTWFCWIMCKNLIMQAKIYFWQLNTMTLLWRTVQTTKSLGEFFGTCRNLSSVPLLSL